MLDVFEIIASKLDVGVDLSRMLYAGARKVGSVMTDTAPVKKIFILCLLLTTAYAKTALTDIEVSHDIMCDMHTMHMNINFSRSFEGSVYVLDHLFIPNCSFITPMSSSVSELRLQFPLFGCGLQDGENLEIVTGFVVVQLHRMIQTVFDHLIPVSCRVPDVVTPLSNPYFHNESPLVSAMSELKTGLDLFGEENPAVEQTLFFIVYVNYSSSINKTYEGLVVHNCLAYDSEILTNETIISQFSDPYGCPSESFSLPNFTVAKGRHGRAMLEAYTVVKNLTLFVKGELHLSCGVALCENSCPGNCDGEEHFSPGHLSAIAFKDIAKRHPGARIPTSLQRLSKRSPQNLSGNDNELPLTVKPKSSKSLVEKLGNILSAFKVWKFINNLDPLNDSISSERVNNRTTIESLVNLFSSVPLYAQPTKDTYTATESLDSNPLASSSRIFHFSDNFTNAATEILDNKILSRPDPEVFYQVTETLSTSGSDRLTEMLPALLVMAVFVAVGVLICVCMNARAASPRMAV